MSGGSIELGGLDLALAATLVLLNGAASLALGLGLGRRLAVAAARTVVQLTLVGLVLEEVFARDSPWLVIGLALFMTGVAAHAGVRRARRRHSGVWLDGVVSIWASSWLVTAFALVVVLRVSPWYQPQYAVPLLGMVLGNALNGISLGLERLGEELTAQRGRTEMLLSLGATRWEAGLPAVRRAATAGMIPILNTMSVVGLVSLPGMMTGQLLAGADPAQAVRYQIVIMFVIAGATALGTVGVVTLSWRRLFDADHRFLAARLSGVERPPRD